MEQDWFDKSIRSFAMRLLSLNELDVILLVNGECRDKQFRLPSDTEWQPLWCSAETTGACPAKGTEVEKLDLSNEDSIWTHFVPKDTRIGQVIQEVQSTQDDPEERPSVKPWPQGNNDVETVTLPGLTAKTRIYRVLAHSEAQQRVAQDRQRMLKGLHRPQQHAGDQQHKQDGNSPVEASTQQSVSGAHSNLWTVPSMSITIMRQTTLD